jgi:hypothetical protein
MIESDTDELTNKISNMSMTEPQAISNSLIRTVTLPTTDDNESSTETHIAITGSRPSIDSIVVGDKLTVNLSRPSFDGHTYSGELTQHMYGHISPRVCSTSAGRPPKKVSISNNNSNLMDSVQNQCISVGGNTRYSRTPNNTENPCFVTTYVLI